MNATAKKIITAVAVTAAFLVGYYILSFLVGLCMTPVAVSKAVYEIQNAGGSPDDIELLNNTFQKIMIGYSSLIALISGIICITVALLIILLKYKNGTWDMAKIFRIRQAPGKFVSVCICSLLLGIALNFFSMNLISIIPVPESWINANNESVSSLFLGNIVISLLATSLVAPVCEELLFRGISYHMLRDALPLKRIIAAVIAGGAVSLLFGLFHGNILQGIYTFTLSVILVTVTERTGSIWAPILVHVGFNSTWLTGNLAAEFLSEGKEIRNMLIFLAVSAVLGVLIFALSKHREQNAAGNDNSGAN